MDLTACAVVHLLRHFILATRDTCRNFKKKHNPPQEQVRKLIKHAKSTVKQQSVVILVLCRGWVGNRAFGVKKVVQASLPAFFCGVGPAKRLGANLRATGRRRELFVIGWLHASIPQSLNFFSPRPLPVSLGGE